MISKWVAAPTAAAGSCSLANALHDATKEPRKIERRRQRLAASHSARADVSGSTGLRRTRGGPRLRRRRLQLLKTAGSIKPDGPQLWHRPRGARRASPFPGSLKATVDQPPSKASASKARQEVDVEVRWIAFDDLSWRVMGVVYPVNHQLVGAPPGARRVGRITVDLPEIWPPLGFQLGPRNCACLERRRCNHRPRGRPRRRTRSAGSAPRMARRKRVRPASDPDKVAQRPAAVARQTR